MKRNGWYMEFQWGDTNLPVNSIRRNDLGYGGAAVFTQAALGIFLGHGSFGTDPDYSPGSSGSYQTYFRSDADGGDNGWLRMCQFGFGGNLKWMGILACNSLSNYLSMSSVGAIPLDTTHLVCGASTIAALGEDIGAFWAKKMLGRNGESIANAWFDAARTEYSNAIGMTGPYVFCVAGYPECMGDTIKNNTAPSNPSPAPRNLTRVESQVYP